MTVGDRVAAVGRTAIAATTALSLTVAVLLGVLWPVGHWRPTAVVLFGPAGRPMVVAVGRGTVGVIAATLSVGPDRAWSALWLTPSADEFDDDRDSLPRELETVHDRHGFLAGVGSDPMSMPDTRVVAVAAPAWAVWPATLVLPTAWYVRLRRRRRRVDHGLCPTCRYDLRGSTLRCPECGRVIESKRTSNIEHRTLNIEEGRK